MEDGAASPPSIPLGALQREKKPKVASKPMPAMAAVEDRIRELGSPDAPSPKNPVQPLQPLKFDFGNVANAPPKPQPIPAVNQYMIAKAAFDEGAITGIIVGAGAVLVGGLIYWYFCSGSGASIPAVAAELKLVPVKAAKAAKIVA